MSLTVTRSPRLIMLHGELSRATRSALQALIDEHLPGSGDDLILDLTHVSAIDSAGLGLLVGCLRHVSATGGALAIAGLQPAPARIFRLLGATPLFDCQPDVEAAARSIARRSPRAARPL
jgi:anti-sigma B factor antagonist